MSMVAQRDAFISKLFEIAKEDKDVYFLSVDMGAPSLDRWREELPEQFLPMGISEQHAINFAAGLASAGKKVYVYYMAAWSARCFEQVRYSCAMAENPITILGCGVGLGYAPAGPAHSPNEDLAYMRSLCGIEIYSPSNNAMIDSLVELTHRDPKLRYIRLERKAAQELEPLYSDVPWCTDKLKEGVMTIHRQGSSASSCIVSCGYMLGRAVKAASMMSLQGYDVDVVDLWKAKEVNHDALRSALDTYDNVITLEEQSLSGGLGSIVCESLSDMGIFKRVLRLGLPDKYLFENGTRDHLLDTNGLSVADIGKQIMDFIGVEN
jgi:transketolase